MASPVSRRADKGIEVIDWDQLPLWVRHGSWCRDPPPMPWIGGGAQWRRGEGVVSAAVSARGQQINVEFLRYDRGAVAGRAAQTWTLNQKRKCLGRGTLSLLRGRVRAQARWTATSVRIGA